jgi:hypothetical protein
LSLKKTSCMCEKSRNGCEMTSTMGYQFIGGWMTKFKIFTNFSDCLEFKQ